MVRKYKKKHEAEMAAKIMRSTHPLRFRPVKEVYQVDKKGKKTMFKLDAWHILDTKTKKLV